MEPCRGQVRLFPGVALAGLLLPGCASWTATRVYRITEAPFYRGELSAKPANVARLPVVVESSRDFSTNSIFRRKELDALLPAVERELDALAILQPLPTPSASDSDGPALYVGVDRSTDARVNVMRVRTPSRRARTLLAAALHDRKADYALFVSVSLTDHWVRQKGLLGKKSVELGTANPVSIPWLTDLDTPVQILQINGVLLDREGKVVRGGAEGLAFKRTSFSWIPGQEVLTAGELTAVLDERRDDLEGAPRRLEAAVRNLVGQLLGRDHLLMTTKASPRGDK
jgi:hypothetical protein